MAHSRSYLQPVRQGHLRIALAAVSTILLILAPIMLSALVTVGSWHVRAGWALAGGVLVAIPLCYLIAKLLAARRGDTYVTPTTFLVLASIATMAIACAHMASRPWNGNVFIAMLVLPCIAFAVATDLTVLLVGWLLVTITIALCLSVEHLPPELYWTQLMMFASIDLAAALAVAPAIRALSRRSSSRAGLQELTKKLAGATSAAAGLEGSLPLIPEILPCESVVVYARDDGELTPLAQWHDADADPPAPPGAGEVPPLGRATLIGSRCYVPAGYAPEGELVMVIDGIDRLTLPRFFAEEAANGLSSALSTMTSRIAYVSRLEHESRTDALTGLANRRVLKSRLEVLVSMASRAGTPLTVAMIDLDRFKQFNDTLGHQSGDRLLRALAQAMSERLRTQDLLARYGGEEFCLVLPDTALPAAQGLLEELRILASAVLVEGRSTTLSAGAAEWQRGESVEHLLARADRALYDAKQAGRDRVVAAARS